MLDTPILPKTNVQPKTVLEISLLERFKTQNKLITTTHAKFGEILKLKAMNSAGMQKILPYAEPLYRPPPRLLDIHLLNSESTQDISKEILPYADPVYRHPPRSPDILLLNVPRI